MSDEREHVSIDRNTIREVINTLHSAWVLADGEGALSLAYDIDASINALTSALGEDA